MKAKTLTDQQRRFALELEDSAYEGEIEPRTVNAVLTIYATSFYKGRTRHQHVPLLCRALTAYYFECVNSRIAMNDWRRRSRLGETLPMPVGPVLPAL